MKENTQLVRKYPTDRSGEVTNLQPTITLDWSISVDSTQFSTPLSLSKLVKLSKKDTSEYLPLSYVSYDATLKRVSLQPTSALVSGTTYTIEVNTGVLDSVGRQSIQRYVWDFTTAASTVANVAGLLPATASVQTVFPSFSWTALTPNTFEFQLDDTPEFTSPLESQSLSTNTFTPAGVLPSNKTYYWRVRAVNGLLLGNWSETQSFYFGEVRTAHPTTQTVWSTGVFALSALSFKNGLSNQANFPAIRITLSEDIATGLTISDYVTVNRKMVLPRNDDRTTYDDVAVPGTYSYTGKVITFTPTELIKENYRYKIKVAGDLSSITGLVLGDELEFYFTSRYSPYYVDISAVRARFLSAEKRIPDDLINYYIYQASLEAHSMVVSTFATSLNGLLGPFNYDAVKEYLIRDATKFNSFGVLKWTECLATFRLLQSILREELRNVGRERKQGEYLEKLDADFLKAIQAAKDDAKSELDQWAQAFGLMDTPSSVSVGSAFDPNSWDYQAFAWREGMRDNNCM